MELLQREQAALERFIALLRQEQAALVNADVEALQSLSEQKIHYSEELNALAQERAAMLRQAGVPPHVEGVRAWLAEQPPAVAQAWQKLLGSARTAQRLNQINGTLIQTHLQHNQQALAILMSAANKADVYGADGQPQIGSDQSARTLGKV